MQEIDIYFGLFWKGGGCFAPVEPWRRLKQTAIEQSLKKNVLKIQGLRINVQHNKRPKYPTCKK